MGSTFIIVTTQAGGIASVERYDTEAEAVAAYGIAVSAARMGPNAGSTVYLAMVRAAFEMVR